MVERTEVIVPSPPFIKGDENGGFDRLRVSVVIPTLNEADNLPYVLPRIPKWITEVIIVDGRSSDGTVDVARQLLPNCRIILEPRPGKGTALCTGFEAATGDIIVMLDADGSMAPEEIPLFVGALLAGADYVKGSRFTQGGGTHDMEPHRYLGNMGLVTTSNLLFRASYTDLCYGYNAFWRRHLHKLDLSSSGFEIETEMNLRALRAGLKVLEVPSFEAARIHGFSHLNSVRDGTRVLRQIFLEFLDWQRRKSEPPTSNSMVLSTNVKPAEADLPSKPSLPLEPPMPPTQISVVIRTYTDLRWSQLLASVDSVLAQSVPPNELILVVDHNPVLADRLRKQWNRPEIRVVENAQERGSSTAWNTGIYAARGDIVAFIDDDAIASSSWLSQLVQLYTQQGIVGVGGVICPQWEGERPFWFPDEFDWVVGCSYRGLPTTVAPVRNIIGCNMSFLRTVLLNVNGLRVEKGLGHLGSTPIGGDETELCIRIGKHYPTAQILHCPSAIVHHTVPKDRASFRYFVKRCYLEGRSKAVIARLSGTSKELSAEARQAFRVIPRGIARNLGQAVHQHDLGGFARATTLAFGLMVVGSGYAVGRLANFASRGKPDNQLHMPPEVVATSDPDRTDSVPL